MTHSISISYLPCQNCHAKLNCDECSTRLEDALMRIQNINGASIQIAAKQAMVDSEVDSDTLETILENLGLFVD